MHHHDTPTAALAAWLDREEDTMGYPNYDRQGLPTIVCLCGSTRFSEAFQSANLSETLAGRIVLTIGCDMRSDDALGLPLDTKARLDELHLRKIDLCDEVLVLNVGRYIGESTRREIDYAESRGKRIRYLEPIDAAQLTETDPVERGR